MHICLGYQGQDLHGPQAGGGVVPVLRGPAPLQAGLWAFLSVSGKDSENLSRILSCSFLAAVSLLAAAGFLLYGGRLFLMLRRSAPSLCHPFCWLRSAVSPAHIAHLIA